MEEVPCDLCDSDQSTITYRINVVESNMRYYRYARNVPDREQMTGEQRIVTCSNCGLIYTNPRFSPGELQKVYSSDRIIGGNWKNFPYLFDSSQPDVFQSGQKSTSYNPGLYQWKFDIIQHYTGKKTKGIRLLDLGCGDGKFVHDALQRGYDARGIDLSPDRIRKGREVFGLDEERLRCMNADDFSSEDQFDVIVMWDIIEHVGSPASILQSIKKICHPRTLVFILTMSVDSITYKLFGKNWNYVNPTQHLTYFSHRTMREMLQKSGFQLMGVEMDDSRRKNVIHLVARILLGQANRFFFYVYTRKNFLRKLFRPFQGEITDERMHIRLENLYPGSYIGRYHDNFVFVSKPEK
ncbi:class I SAM-dependent methyltransferase [Roseivirga sp. BDSF3-8]|uniref:class I SAM-dependent methyltransferase n=1 Tax=Roseivirga sp. BDSF3-8 TaxID=3241598 RepID=UPI003531A1DA